MTDAVKIQIGRRLRKKREQAGYTREELGELCSLSPRFIANIELGDSTFSLDSLMTACRTLSCSSDYLLFGKDDGERPWAEICGKLEQLDLRYQKSMDKIIQGFVEAIHAKSYEELND